MEPGRKVRQVSAALPVTPECLRAVAKIAFHYFLAQAPGGMFTGHEAAFDATTRGPKEK